MNEKIRYNNACLLKETATSKENIWFVVKYKEEIKAFTVEEKESLLSVNENFNNIHKELKCELAVSEKDQEELDKKLICLI